MCVINNPPAPVDKPIAHREAGTQQKRAVDGQREIVSLRRGQDEGRRSRGSAQPTETVLGRSAGEHQISEKGTRES